MWGKAGLIVCGVFTHREGVSHEGGLEADMRVHSRRKPAIRVEGVVLRVGGVCCHGERLKGPTQGVGWGYTCTINS